MGTAEALAAGRDFSSLAGRDANSLRGGALWWSARVETTAGPMKSKRSATGRLVIGSAGTTEATGREMAESRGFDAACADCACRGGSATPGWTSRVRSPAPMEDRSGSLPIAGSGEADWLLSATLLAAVSDFAEAAAEGAFDAGLMLSPGGGSGTWSLQGSVQFSTCVECCLGLSGRGVFVVDMMMTAATISPRATMTVSKRTMPPGAGILKSSGTAAAALFPKRAYAPLGAVRETLATNGRNRLND